LIASAAQLDENGKFLSTADCKSSLIATIKSAKSETEQKKVDPLAIHGNLRSFIQKSPAKCNYLNEIAVDLSLEIPYAVDSEGLQKLQQIDFDKYIQSVQVGFPIYPKAPDMYDGSHSVKELAEYLQTLSSKASHAKESGNLERLDEAQDDLRRFIRRARVNYLIEHAGKILSSL